MRAVHTRCVYWGDFVDLPTCLTVKCMCFQAVKGVTIAHAAQVQCVGRAAAGGRVTQDLLFCLMNLLTHIQKNKTCGPCLCWSFQRRLEY